MSRALTARQTELSERRALAPVPLLKLTTYTDREAQTGAVDRYFSDRPLQYDYGNTGTLRDFAPDILEVEPLVREMVHIPAPETTGDQVRRLAVVRMRNSIDALGEYLIKALRDENLEGAIVELAQLLVDRDAGEALQGDLSGLVGDEHLVWFRGQVHLVTDTTESEFTLTLRSILPSIDAPILNTPTENDPLDLGERLNQVYGDRKKVPCHGVKVGWATALSQSITRSQTGTVQVSDGTGFPAGTFAIRLSGERIECNTATATTINLVTRADGGGTVEAAHAAGEIIIEEETDFIYEVAGHECNAVDAVYVVNPFNQELVRVSSGVDIDLADTTSIPGETITSLSFTEPQIASLFDSFHAQSHIETQPVHDAVHDHNTGMAQEPVTGNANLRDGDLGTTFAVPIATGHTLTFTPPDGTVVSQTVHVVFPQSLGITGTIDIRVGGVVVGNINPATTLIGRYSFPTTEKSNTTAIGFLHGTVALQLAEVSRDVLFTPQDPIVSRNTDVDVVGAQVGFGLRFFADVKGYEVPAADTNYDASAGNLIEKLPDIIRHYIVVRAGGAHADCDATTWAAALTDLGANKHNFVESDLVAGNAPALEQVFARLGWEGRTQVVQAEATAGTVYKLLAANNPAAGTYDWDAALSTVENYQDAHEEGDNLDTVFTRWRFAYDLDRLFQAEQSFTSVLQCDPDQSDIAGITTTEMADAEKQFGRNDHAGVAFLTISDEDTAEDVAGYYVFESIRSKVIAHIEGVPWVEAYAFEIGDIRDATLPWWSSTKKVRLTRFRKDWETELIDLSGVEV